MARRVTRWQLDHCAVAITYQTYSRRQWRKIHHRPDPSLGLLYDRGRVVLLRLSAAPSMPLLARSVVGDALAT